VQPLGRLIPPSIKLKNKQRTVIKCLQQRGGWNTETASEKGAGQRTKFSALNSQWRQALPKAGQVVDRRADLLNQRGAFKAKLPYLTGGGADQRVATEG
jgi:hypothetical protein